VANWSIWERQYCVFDADYAIEIKSNFHNMQLYDETNTSNAISMFIAS